MFVWLLRRQILWQLLASGMVSCVVEGHSLWSVFAAISFLYVVLVPNTASSWWRAVPLRCARGRERPQSLGALGNLNAKPLNHAAFIHCYIRHDIPPQLRVKNNARIPILVTLTPLV